MADPLKQYVLGSEPKLIAECEDMCPEFERHEREYQTGLDKLEKVLLPRSNLQDSWYRKRRSSTGGKEIQKVCCRGSSSSSMRYTSS
jgi:hypothetical protein